MVVPGRLLGLAAGRRLHVLPPFHATLQEWHGSLLLLEGLLLLLLLPERLLLLRLLVWASTVGQLAILLLLLLGIVIMVGVLVLVCHLWGPAIVPIAPELLVHSCIAALAVEKDPVLQRIQSSTSELSQWYT